MENRIIVAGFGGQGVLMNGQLLCYAAFLNDKKALFLPKYGAEQRGGTAKCDVTISDSVIYSPFTKFVDVLMAMNEPSLLKFEPFVNTGGTILMNSSRCVSDVKREDVKVCKIAADEIAEKIGSQKVANIVMLGAYVKCAGMLTKEEVWSAIQTKLAKKPQFMEMNRIALEEGIKNVL